MFQEETRKLEGAAGHAEGGEEGGQGGEADRCSNKILFFHRPKLILSSTETPGSKGKKRKGGKVETPKSHKKKTKAVDVKQKIIPELPKSPRKEGSVMHPFFRLANINVSVMKK